MIVIASKENAQQVVRPTYGDLIGKVIASGDLSQGSKSAYLIATHPGSGASERSSLCILVPLEHSGTPSLANCNMPLGTGYKVYERATLVLEGLL